MRLNHNYIILQKIEFARALCLYYLFFVGASSGMCSLVLLVLAVCCSMRATAFSNHVMRRQNKAVLSFTQFASSPELDISMTEESSSETNKGDGASVCIFVSLWLYHCVLHFS